AALVALVSSGFAAAQPPASPPRTAPAAPTGAPANAEPGTSAALPADAPERTLAAWFGHVESDNLARTVTPEDGSFDSVGLLLGLKHTSTRLDASIDADLEYRSYSLDSLDNETVGTLSAGAEVDLVQDRFTWELTDAYGQGITDPFAGIGPGNREKVNVIATGPRIDLPLGGRTSLELSGTYSERRFDESTQVDSDSLLYELGMHRQISETARVGVVASSNDVDYVDVIAPKYQIDRLGLRYEKELATGRVLADAGKNQISSGGFDSDEPLYNLVWTRSLTARSELNIRAAREITDAGAALGTALVPGIEGSSFTDVVVNPNPFEQRRFGASYVLTMSRTVVSAGLDSTKDEYFGNALYDNDSTALHVSFVRTISQQLSFGIGYDRIDRDFTDAAGAQPDGRDDWTGAWLSRAFGRRFSLGLAISSYDRSGAQSYDEQRYELRFGYSPTDSGATAMSSVGR
ncbi:MAG TPA: hypothetical protein VF405_06470, partial [Gammaproteobacteria bacterium]